MYIIFVYIDKNETAGEQRGLTGVGGDENEDGQNGGAVSPR